MKASGLSFNKAGTYLWIALFIIAVFIWRFAQDYRTARLFLLLSAPILWIGLVALARRWKAISLPLLFIGIAALAFLCLPGREVDSTRLRAFYVESLAEYKGTPYVWGGESRFGMPVHVMRWRQLERTLNKNRLGAIKR